MELLYLWIDSYSNISNVPFQFSNEFEIKYDKGSDTLDISKSQSDELKLFDSSFLSITAIIGKNGSGKSSLLSFIQKIYSDDQIASFEDFVMVIKKQNGEGEENEEFTYITNNFRDRIKNITGDYSISQSSFKEIREQVNLIFLSNSFSIYEGWDPSPGYIDLSLQNMLFDFNQVSNKELIERYEDLLTHKEELEKEDRFNLEKKYLVDFTSTISLLYKSELRSKINFITKYKEEFKDFIPQTVNITFNLDYFRRNDALFEKLNELKIFNFFSRYLTKHEVVNEPDEIKWFRNGLIVSILLYILENSLFNQTKNLKESDIISKLEGSEIEEFPQIILDFILEGELFIEKYDFFEIQSFLKDIDPELSKLNIGYHKPKGIINLIIDADFELFIKRFNGLSYNILQLFSCKWDYMSAGESALLTIFARLYNVSNKFVTNNIWLLIDEGELYLHPEWQRTFLNKLHKYLPKFFKSKNIQLILTSHSPFIISDLTKENIILLDKDKESGHCIVVDNSSFGETFGANIHELLAHSFFMEDGTIGEFAKNKIDSLFKFLNSDSEEDAYWSLENAWKLIGIVGDEIVKRYLIELYNKKIMQISGENNNSEFIDDQIKKLQQTKKKMKGDNK